MTDLLVITPDAWRSVGERLVRYKNDTGMSAALLTLGEIEAAVAGIDQPERIKRAIEQRHRADQVRYVLLAGDVDWFPVRYIKLIATAEGTQWYPSDLYYADLYDSDGRFDAWDADGDGIFAELDFDHLLAPQFNVDTVNLYPDVAVGRVPASSEAEWARYVDKVIRYEFAARESRDHGNPDGWFRRAIFAVDGGKEPFGDEGISAQQEAPLAAAGIGVIHRYQDSPPWSAMSDEQRRAELVSLLDDGAGFLHFLGHGNRSSFAGWLEVADVPTLSNALALPVVVAMACSTAQFQNDRDAYRRLLGGDWTGSATPAPDRPQPAPVQPVVHDRDSMAEAFLVQTDNGGIAYVGLVEGIEHGGKVIGQYFTEAYRDLAKPAVLGDMWTRTLASFVTNELHGGTAGMGGFYAFIHVHKTMLFGDPSLRVGGLAPAWQGSGAAVVPPAVLVSLASA